jgi:hypothetical protein
VKRYGEHPHKSAAVIAGLVPATPIIGHVAAFEDQEAPCLIIGVAGASPAMTM